jgi:predicted GNAT family acetyltransferase
MHPIVQQNIALHRFEIHLDGDLIGICDYTQHGNRLSFTHTEIEPAHSGKGYAKLLVETALEEAATQHREVVPYCSYIRKIIQENPDHYLALVPTELHQQFNLLS